MTTARLHRDSLLHTSDSLLHISNLRLQIGERVLCNDLNLNISPGQRVALLGQNGTGKTTLLHTLIGFRQPAAGAITVCQRPIGEWSRKELSCNMGMLFQHLNDDMPSTVLETALLGRHPHIAPWRWDNFADIESARQALTLMDLLPLENREIFTLSGGERQRLAMAMLLVQNPRLYLLDEPGNHLDISFQIKSLEILNQQISKEGAAMCMATHDINIAARFCDQVVLLLGNGEHVVGPTEQILTPELLGRAFSCRIDRVWHEEKWIYYPV